VMPRLNGSAGNDSFDLRGGGALVVAGGDGDDTYVINNLTHTIIEAADGGSDLVRSSVSYTLGDNLENLTLFGAAAVNATGNALANVISGNSAANTLRGEAGADTLYGYGGDDQLHGGNGNDIVYGGSGLDLIYGDDGNDHLFGEGDADTLHGGDGDDTLDGGAGIDWLYGGAGNDAYIVTEGDVVVELANGGYDTVYSAITWTLESHVEQLVLTGNQKINGAGNAQANTLIGNTNANVLTGGGGADYLSGGDGNDTLNGGSGDDSVIGGAGRDLINGGVGNDLLTGGDGIDSFVFNTALSASTNVDIITDFTSGTDRIRLDDDIFTVFDAAIAKKLLAGNLRQGDGVTEAQDANDYIIYDSSTGALYYDADGLGGVAAVQFAQLGVDEHPTSLRVADFLIIA
jgi:serralysin